MGTLHDVFFEPLILAIMDADFVGNMSYEQAVFNRGSFGNEELNVSHFSLYVKDLVLMIDEFNSDPGHEPTSERHRALGIMRSLNLMNISLAGMLDGNIEGQAIHHEALVSVRDSLKGIKNGLFSSLSFLRGFCYLFEMGAPESVFYRFYEYDRTLFSVPYYARLYNPDKCPVSDLDRITIHTTMLVMMSMYLPKMLEQFVHFVLKKEYRIRLFNEISLRHLITTNTHFEHFIRIKNVKNPQIRSMVTTYTTADSVLAIVRTIEGLRLL